MDVLLIVTLHRQLRLERVHFDLHLRKVHVGFADLLSFLRNHSLKVALLFGELSLELRCKLSPQLFDLHSLFSCTRPPLSCTGCSAPASRPSRPAPPSGLASPRPGAGSRVPRVPAGSPCPAPRPPCASPPSFPPCAPQPLA